MPSFIAPSEERGRVHSTVLLASNAGKRKRALRAREVLTKEMKEGTFTVHAKKVKGAWGWLPWRRRHRQDVDRAKANLGIVEVSIDGRARLVSHENWCFDVFGMGRQRGVAFLHTSYVYTCVAVGRIQVYYDHKRR